MSPSWSYEALFQEVLVAPRRGFVPLPDTQVIERPGWMQLITPSLRQGGMNEVSLSILGDHEADAVIDATIAQYRSLGLSFRWSVGPDGRPLDLAERLRSRGLRPVDAQGMYYLLNGLLPQATLDTSTPRPDLSIERIDERSVDEFSRTTAAGWNMDPGPVDRLHRLMLADPRRQMRLYLARHQGAPAGTAGLCLFERSAYLIGAVVLPPFRGLGLYRALVQARLRDAAARGITLATSQAQTATSAPLLARLGFQSLCPLQFYCA